MFTQGPHSSVQPIDQADATTARRRLVRSVVTLAVGGLLATIVPAAPALAGGRQARVVKVVDGLSYPQAPAFNGSGNLYFADRVTSVIHMVTPGADGFVNGKRDEVVTTVAGIPGSSGFSGDGGPATSATINSPAGVALDGAGNLYIGDQYNHRIRKVSPGTDGVLNGGSDETITTVAGSGTCAAITRICTVEEIGDGGPAASAKLHFPTGVAVDAGGNLYIADLSNHRVRRVDSAGTITTVAGTGTRGSSGDGGPAITAEVTSPIGVTVDGSKLFVTGQGEQKVRLVNLGPDSAAANGVTVASGNIQTVAGTGAGGFAGDDGPATSASLASPFGTAVDGSGNLYVSDQGNNRVRQVDAAGTITTLTGPRTLAAPRGLAVHGSGGLYVADTDNQRIGRIQL